MATSLTIRATLTEAVNDEGIGNPVAVVILGASMLGKSALADIAGELVDAYYGNASHDYRAQYTGFNTGEVVTVPVVKLGAEKVTGPIPTERPLGNLNAHWDTES